MFRKLIGVLFLLIGLLGLAFSVTGVVLGRQAVDELGSAIDTALSRSLVSLGTAGDTLVLTKSTFEQVNAGLDTVGATAENVAQTLRDTQPLLDGVSNVVASEIPDSLEAIQNSIPGVADAAGTIDDTLRTLNAFEVEREIFGIPISFDLGINYDPEVSLDDSVNQIGQSIDGMPDSLRALRSDLDLANDNLENVSSNITTIASDLEALGDNVQQIEPLVDEYIQLVADIEQLINQTQEKLDSQLELVKLVVTLLFVWIGINQIVPLYLSVDIFTHKSKKDVVSPDSPDASGMATVETAAIEEDLSANERDTEEE
jgi:methyl-accepting chemotaxis protein